MSLIFAGPHAGRVIDVDGFDDVEPVAAVPMTTVVVSKPPPTVEPPRRKVRGMSQRDLLTIAGAAISSMATTLLIFGRLTPLSGTLGFVLVAFAMFVATYAVLVSLTERLPAVIDRVTTVLMGAAAVTALGALVSVIGFTLWRGRSALFRSNAYTDDLSRSGPLDGLDKGGISHAIVGSLIITGIALLITVPLGIACAVYLTETRGRLNSLVRTVVTSMTALPSILAGLLVFSTLILILHFERSGLAASLAVSIVMLPIIVRASDVVLRLVPGNLREAAAALGAPQWRVVWHVVLPTARAGLTTAVILGVARGVGETAPVLLTAGFTASMNVNPTSGAMVNLPLVAYSLVKSPLPTQIARGFAAAAVLMVLVLILFTLARLLGGRPVGQLSKRQSQRAAARSARDLERIHASKDSATSPIEVPT